MIVLTVLSSFTIRDIVSYTSSGLTVECDEDNLVKVSVCLSSCVSSCSCNCVIVNIRVETHDGVQDMACDTFIKISSKCRRHFVQVQIGEVMPFIDDVLNSTNTIICDLQPQQVFTLTYLAALALN